MKYLFTFAAVGSPVDQRIIAAAEGRSGNTDESAFLRNVEELIVTSLNEVPDAIRKSVENAKKSIYKINLNKNTIPHEVIGRFKSAKVILKPASPGTGIIAGASVRAVVEKAGILDILTKSQGSRNPLNIAKATLNGLLQLRSLKEVADLRDIPLNRLMGS